MQMYDKQTAGYLAFLFALVIQFASPSVAQDGVSLEVSGAIDPAELSLEELDLMDQIRFETSTIWTDGVTRFSGVSLKRLLEDRNATGNLVQMIALNDYAIKIPVEELGDEAPIIATRMNGEPMPIRDKGPYWVVFPYDSDPQYQSEIVYSRSIWQLNRLVVTEE
jgi:hypothetical protein